MKIFLFVVISFSSFQVFARTSPASPIAVEEEVPADPVGEAPNANPNSQFNSESAQQLDSCEEAGSQITFYCSHNPQMIAAQEATGLGRMMQSIKLMGGELVGKAQTQAESSKMSIAQIRKACSEAASICNTKCVEKAKAAGKKYTEIINSGSPTAQQEAQPLLDISNRAKEIVNQCREEHDSTQAAIAKLDFQLGEVLMGLAAIAQALGLGDKSGGTDLASDDDDEEDKCEGQYGDLLIECKGQSDPSATRAGLAGAGLNGAPGGAGASFNMGAVEEGTPGGTSKDNGNGSGSNPFNGAGFAGGISGLGSTGAGVGAAGSGGSGTGEDGPNTDIDKGFMSAGSGGGSGFSGGGGAASASPRPLGNFDGGGKSNFDKAALQKKLSKYAKVGGGRAPASAGGASGPFEDIWGVVNKAYKKNSGSMFHQR